MRVGTKLATKRGSRAVAAAAALAVLPGCGTTVGGTAHTQSVSTPENPKQVLLRVLPTAAEVSEAVGNRLDTAGDVVTGSIDMLPNGIRDSAGATPLDCLGAVTPLMKVVYAGAGVRAVALQNYARFGRSMRVSSAEAGVVQFDSDAEAARMFARFVTQWQSCEGTTVTMHVTRTAGLDLTVTDVRVNGPVLSATILSDGGDGTVFPTEHAVGVAADCIVDVDVAVTDPDPTQRVAAGRAANLVRMMLAKT